MNQNLTAYQQQIGRSVLASVLGNRSLTFTVETLEACDYQVLSAHIEQLLLTVHVNDGATLLRIAPPGVPGTYQHHINWLSRNDLRDLWSVEKEAIRFGNATLHYIAPDDLISGIVRYDSDIALIEIVDIDRIPTEVFDDWILPLVKGNGATVIVYGDEFIRAIARDLKTYDRCDCNRPNAGSEHLPIIPTARLSTSRKLGIETVTESHGCQEGPEVSVLAGSGRLPSG